MKIPCSLGLSKTVSYLPIICYLLFHVGFEYVGLWPIRNPAEQIRVLEERRAFQYEDELKEVYAKCTSEQAALARQQSEETGLDELTCAISIARENGMRATNKDPIEERISGYDAAILN